MMKRERRVRRPVVTLHALKKSPGMIGLSVCTV